MVSVDEDRWEFPSAWKGSLLRRRGGAPGSKLPPTADGTAMAAHIIDANRTTIRALLDNEDHELTEAGRRQLDDSPALDPVGAGVVAAASAHAVGWSKPEQLAVLADAWVEAGGLLFAARTVVEMSDISVTGGPYGFQPAPFSIARSTSTSGWGHFAHWHAVAGRVRSRLAEAADEQYAEAIDALDAYRARGPRPRLATSFLLPTQTAWVDADCDPAISDGYHVAALMWCSAGTAEQARSLADRMSGYAVPSQQELVTALDGIGPSVAPTFTHWYDEPHTSSETKQRILGALAHVPTDEALAAAVARLDGKNVQPTVIEMAKRYPRRALRVLAEAAVAGTAAAQVAKNLLRSQVVAYPDLVTELLPTMSPAAQAGITAMFVAGGVPTAPAQALPDLLVSPPWTRKKRASGKATTLALPRPEEKAVRWRTDERESWASAPLPGWVSSDRNWKAQSARMREGRLSPWETLTFFAQAPEELARPLIHAWEPTNLWGEDLLRMVVARFGLDALPAALVAARSAPATNAYLLSPFATAEVAELMADWFARLKSARPLAAAWLTRHSVDAARVLIPAALGKAGVPRRNAEQALRGIAAAGNDADVRVVAKEYGDAAVAGVEALLSVDPLDLLPSRMPLLPDWTAPALLPQILLRGREMALPPSAVEHLCTMLAISRLDEPYAGLAKVQELCDPDSLAAFGWALFEQWQSVGAPAKESWAFTCLRFLGDDAAVRRLSPLIRSWPGEGWHARAVTGLDVLAGIGTDLALMHLYNISQKVKFKGLKDRAGDKISEVARELGLTPEQLGDRLVPDLGLDTSGSLVLDYGPRRFTVGFDEQLKPYVAAEDGSRRAALPKPGARDDQDLATAAYQRFTGLKKDVRTIATEQIGRLELAMVNQRRWTGTEFRELFVAHPVLWHIVRRLVWGNFEGGDGPVAFRVAEDRTFSDVADDTYLLPDDASVGIAHPLHLGDSVAAWSELFADYEILQPFNQLGRTVHTLTPEETEAKNLTRFTQFDIPTGKVIGLERRGWRRGEPMDAGVRCWMVKPIPGGRAIVANIDPGVPVGMSIDEYPEQRFTEIWVNNRAEGDWHGRGAGLPLRVLDPVVASELLRDLIEATAK